MKSSKIILIFTLSAFMLLNLQAQSLKVEQVKDTLYQISLKPGKWSKMEWSETPDTWERARAISRNGTLEQKVVLNSYHPIVRIYSVSPKPLYAAPRAIMLQGAVNFRDLGGYMTKDGKQVKWGKIYRSADISKLTEADLKVVQSLNIKMVCDLRGEKEAEAAPDKLVAGTDRILLPAGSENVTGKPTDWMKYMKNPESADSMMASFYTRTDHLKAKYKPMFDQLLALEDDKALMFHCTAGKDRTGVGAALILSALGVDETTVLQDYELTNEYRKSSNEQYIKMMTAQGLPENAAKSMMAANPKYLKAALDAITQKYGSMDAFLEKEMELTPEKRNLLKKKFLY
jgi:protein-tyrosine phosphatase